MSGVMIFALVSLTISIICCVYVLYHTFCWPNHHTWVLIEEQNGVGVYCCHKCGKEKVSYANIGKWDQDADYHGDGTATWVSDED